MKTLTLLRHAKAKIATAGEDDHGRALSKRGRYAAALAGAVLGRNRPELVLCSTSARTRETYAILAETWSGPPAVQFDDKLYMAEAAALTRRLEQVPPEIGSVLLIGHNPGLHDLARRLAGQASNASAFPALALRFPTTAWVSFALDTDRWAPLTRIPSRVLSCEFPPRD